MRNICLHVLLFATFDCYWNILKVGMDLYCIPVQTTCSMDRMLGMNYSSITTRELPPFT